MLQLGTFKPTLFDFGSASATMEKKKDRNVKLLSLLYVSNVEE